MRPITKLLSGLALALWAFGAQAQQPVVAKNAFSCTISGVATTCYTNAAAMTPVVGTQQISSGTLAAATKLTVPKGATTALIIATGTNGTNGDCVRWEDDGTIPTGTTGMPLAALTPLAYATTALASIQFIQSSGATCTLNIAYYK